MGNLPNALKGVEYKAKGGSNYKIEATGDGPFTYFARTGEGFGAFPKGLSLNPTTGEIVGASEEAGTFGVSITVSNKFGSDNVLAWLRVYEETDKPQITTTEGTLPDGYVNSLYFQFINFTDNTGNFSTVSITKGKLPDGLEIKRVGVHAAIDGTPTTPGTFTFTVHVENSLGFDEKQYTITIKEEVAPPKIQMEMTVINDSYSKVDDSGDLQIIKGKKVDVQFYATGINTSKNLIKWSCDTSVLPEGLTLSESGHLTGTVAESVDLGYSGVKYFSIKLKATNVSSGVEQSNTSSMELIVCENGKIAAVTTISPEALPFQRAGKGNLPQPYMDTAIMTSRLHGKYITKVPKIQKYLKTAF